MKQGTNNVKGAYRTKREEKHIQPGMKLRCR